MKADRTPQPDCPPILGWSALAVASVVAVAWCCWSFLVEKDDQAEDVLTTDAWKPLRDQANHDCSNHAVNWRERALKAEARIAAGLAALEVTIPTGDFERAIVARVRRALMGDK